MVALWYNGSALVMNNDVNLRRARLDHVRVQLPGAKLYFAL